MGALGGRRRLSAHALNLPVNRRKEFMRAKAPRVRGHSRETTNGGQVSIRTLIVDDEPIARRVLREELDELHETQLVGEADNGETALVLIASLRPALVFLDLQMPTLGGFDVLNRLEGGHLPVIVIVTAFDQYAVRAFEAGAIDYLLKPVSASRLKLAVERAKRLACNPLQVAETVVQLQEIAPVPATMAGPRIRKIIGKLGEEYFEGRFWTLRGRSLKPLRLKFKIRCPATREAPPVMPRATSSLPTFLTTTII